MRSMGESRERSVTGGTTARQSPWWESRTVFQLREVVLDKGGRGGAESEQAISPSLPKSRQRHSSKPTTVEEDGAGRARKNGLSRLICKRTFWHTYSLERGGEGSEVQLVCRSKRARVSSGKRCRHHASSEGVQEQRITYR